MLGNVNYLTKSDKISFSRVQFVRLCHVLSCSYSVVPAGKHKFQKTGVGKKKSSVERNLFHQPDQKQQPMSSDFRKKKLV